MSPSNRASIGIALGIVFAGCAISAAVCHLIASNSPRSEVARRLIEQERDELVGKYPVYDPEDQLLSERGLALRQRARQFGRVAIACALLIFAWAAWTN
jgi:hypothetical protein